MTKPKLQHAIAAAVAAAITLAIFSAVASIANEDRALLAATRSVHVLVATKAPDTMHR